MSAPTFFSTPADFGHWLAHHGATAKELIVGFHKVGTGRPSMGWSESVDEALCHGWIDGVRKRIDEASYQIRFTPRLPTSIWSAVNIAKFQALQAEDRTTPAGARAFAARTVKKSEVYAYEQAEVAQLSAAEDRAFQAQAAAWAFWQRLAPGYRRTALHWVVSAKRAETRASRLAKLIEASALGQRLR